MDGATEREGGTDRERVGAGWRDVKDADGNLIHKLCKYGKHHRLKYSKSIFTSSLEVFDQWSICHDRHLLVLGKGTCDTITDTIAVNKGQSET
jgi:hypothetical protein